MNLLIVIVTLLQLCSCRTMQKATEEQKMVSESSELATDSHAGRLLLGASQVKHSSLSTFSGFDNGYEKWIEEQVREYSITGRSDTGGNFPGRLVQTTRTIKERGNKMAVVVQQSAVQDSLRHQQAAQFNQHFRSEILNHQTLSTKRKNVKRTGIPWYVWAGGATTIAVGFWLTKRFPFLRPEFLKRKNSDQ